jgi:hypothetical protein
VYRRKGFCGTVQDIRAPFFLGLIVSAKFVRNHASNFLGVLSCRAWMTIGKPIRLPLRLGPPKVVYFVALIGLVVIGLAMVRWLNLRTRLLAASVLAQAHPPQILEVFREYLKPSAVQAVHEIEVDAAQI